ncbi:MAG: IS3 family transposase ISPpu29 [Legionellaceae bacterium]
MGISLEEKRALLDPTDKNLSTREQCRLLNLHRSTMYYKAKVESDENLLLMRLLDEEYTRHPFKGVLRMEAYLRDRGYCVNAKRVRRLLRLMGLEAIYPKKNLSKANPANKKYPYLLKDLAITKPNQVWSTDITYIRLSQGFIYLVAVIDWYSRYVLSWRLSNSLDASFCIETLEDALMLHGFPEIFNSDQGVQFAREAFTGLLLANGIKISMDAKGRAFDNIFIERLWRSVK